MAMRTGREQPAGLLRGEPGAGAAWGAHLLLRGGGGHHQLGPCAAARAHPQLRGRKQPRRRGQRPPGAALFSPMDSCILHNTFTASRLSASLSFNAKMQEECRIVL